VIRRPEAERDDADEEQSDRRTITIADLFMCPRHSLDAVAATHTFDTVVDEVGAHGVYRQ